MCVSESDVANNDLRANHGAFDLGIEAQCVWESRWKALSACIWLVLLLELEWMTLRSKRDQEEGTRSTPPAAAVRFVCRLSGRTCQELDRRNQSWKEWWSKSRRRPGSSILPMPRRQWLPDKCSLWGPRALRKLAHGPLRVLSSCCPVLNSGTEAGRGDVGHLETSRWVVRVRACLGLQHCKHTHSFLYKSFWVITLHHSW